MHDLARTADAAAGIPALAPGALEAQFAAIVASSDDAIVSKNLQGIVQSWNAAAERIFGYSAAEMIGRPIHAIVPPERGNEEEQILAKLSAGERIDHFRTVRMRKDGKRVSVSVTISPIRDSAGKIVGASKIARDLTGQVELSGRYEAIIASSDDAIVSKDLSGIVQTWNKSAERIFGYTAEEMIGRPITIVIPADRQDEEPRILERLKRGERVDHFETVRMHKSGRKIDVSVTISPIHDATGRVVGASKVARDITTLKQMIREREELLKSEQAARMEAERVSRAKDEFLAVLSHELRTPLNAIVGWSQLLKTGKVVGAELQEGLDTIERNARMQTQLISDLLDMSRIITGKTRLDVRPVDLADVIQQAAATVRPAMEAKQIRMSLVLDPNAGPVRGDANRLQQVVWNLLTNAAKFTPKGGQVQVYLQRINSHVEIAVSDTGQGIKPEFIPQLFLRFTQEDTSTTRRHGGLGLGLAIVRHLVEIHGGTIHASSAGEGQGATFRIVLPLSVVQDARTEAEAAHPSAEPRSTPMPPAMAELAGVKVLVVDDDPDSRHLVKRVLGSRGATMLVAGSAQEGFDVLQRERPDVLLSDIGMPDEDGYSLLRRVRALPDAEGGRTPAVALTAFARSEDRTKALLSGFQMHLPKPVEPAELLAVVANLSGAGAKAGSGR